VQARRGALNRGARTCVYAERLLDHVRHHFQDTSSRCGEAGGKLDRYGLKFSAIPRPQKEQYAEFSRARKLFNVSLRTWPEVAAAELKFEHDIKTD